MKKNINIKDNNILLALMIILTGLCLVGGTYAALTMVIDISVTNGIYNHTTECFDIEYDSGGSIIGILVPSSTSSGGLSGSLTVGINENCNVFGIGNINLNVDSSSDEILVQTVEAHCENSSTLQTLNTYEDESSCTENGGIWVTDGTALKYALYVGTNTEASSVGYINSVGSTINIYNNFNVTIPQEYTVTVWLDGNLSDNTYANADFSSGISISIEQTETPVASSSSSSGN